MHYQFKALSLVLFPKDVLALLNNGQNPVVLEPGQVLLLYIYGEQQIMDEGKFLAMAPARAQSLEGLDWTGIYALRSGAIKVVEPGQVMKLSPVDHDDPHLVPRDRFERYYYPVGEGSLSAKQAMRLAEDVVDIGAAAEKLIDRLISESGFSPADVTRYFR